MKFDKKQLTEALRILGKIVCIGSTVESMRKIYFSSKEVGHVDATATNGNEFVTLHLPVLDDDPTRIIKTAINFKDLRELVKVAGSVVEVQETNATDFPSIPEPCGFVDNIKLPESFSSMLATIMSVSFNDYGVRNILRGINLSCDGLTASDGKQLLHIQMPTTLTSGITIPFPAALVAAKCNQDGLLSVWEDKDTAMFKIVIGNLTWIGKKLSVSYPDWRRIIPEKKDLTNSIQFLNIPQLVDFLKGIPEIGPYDLIQIQTNGDQATILSAHKPPQQLTVPVIRHGDSKNTVCLNRKYLLNFLKCNHHTMKYGDTVDVPCVCTGGKGYFVTMQLRGVPSIVLDSPTTTENSATSEIDSNSTNTTTNINQENTMETQTQINTSTTTTEPTTASEPASLDSLLDAVETLKVSVKALLDTACSLTRKVKEAQIAGKQREKDLLIARRTLERIRLASNF